MFTDLAGFTSKTHEDEAGALRMLREQESLVRPLVEAHGGRQVKAIGDGFLLEFPNALDAVECAVELQRRRSETKPVDGEPPLPMRVGIHLGDVQGAGSDILGDAVNIASRVEPLAEPGGICLTSQVYDQVRNKTPFQFQRLDPKHVKGISEPIIVYRVVLPWTSTKPTQSSSGTPRLAVLPLTNISPDSKDEYFADGLTEELITVLSRLHGLRVIARTSVSQYKMSPKPVRQVAEELGVDAVLEGSVRRAGTRLRITLQLIDVSTEEHRWAENYDRQLDDVFEIQAEVAEKTAAALRLELLGSDREALRRAPTHNIASYDLFLRGIAAFQRTADEGWTRHGVEEAARYFEAAIALDPASSIAYAYLANLLIAASDESIPASEVRPRIPPLVSRALELDPGGGEAHTARGNFALQFEFDWVKAEEEFCTAIRLNPSSMTAHAWYGILLTTLGRFPEAVTEIEAAMELDPLFRQLPAWKVRSLTYARRFPEAIEAAKQLLEKDPGSQSLHLLLGRLYTKVGRPDDARPEAESVRGLVLGATLAVNRALLLSQLGQPEEARVLISDWERGTGPHYLRPSYVAALLTQVGENERALEVLEEDAAKGGRGFWIDFRRTEFDPIRDNPRFLALLAKIGLVP